MLITATAERRAHQGSTKLESGNYWGSTWWISVCASDIVSQKQKGFSTSGVITFCCSFFSEVNRLLDFSMSCSIQEKKMVFRFGLVFRFHSVEKAISFQGRWKWVLMILRKLLLLMTHAICSCMCLSGPLETDRKERHFVLSGMVRFSWRDVYSQSDLPPTETGNSCSAIQVWSFLVWRFLRNPSTLAFNLGSIVYAQAFERMEL